MTRQVQVRSPGVAYVPAAPVLQNAESKYRWPQDRGLRGPDRTPRSTPAQQQTCISHPSRTWRQQPCTDRQECLTIWLLRKNTPSRHLQRASTPGTNPCEMRAAQYACPALTVQRKWHDTARSLPEADAVTRHRRTRDVVQPRICFNPQYPLHVHTAWQRSQYESNAAFIRASFTTEEPRRIRRRARTGTVCITNDVCTQRRAHARWQKERAGVPKNSAQSVLSGEHGVLGDVARGKEGSGDEVAYTVLLLGDLVHRRGDLLGEPVVHLEVRHLRNAQSGRE